MNRPGWTIGEQPLEVALAGQRADRFDSAVVLVATPIVELRATIGDGEQIGLLERSWAACRRELPYPIAGRRHSWTAFLFVTGATGPMLERGCERLLAALEGEATLRWHVAVVPVRGALDTAVTIAEQMREGWVRAGAPSTVTRHESCRQTST